MKTKTIDLGAGVAKLGINENYPKLQLWIFTPGCDEEPDKCIYLTDSAVARLADFLKEPNPKP